MRKQIYLLQCFAVMDYKYRTLLQNVPVRHLINRMKTEKTDVEKQLKRLSDVDLNNIFLLSSIKNAERYLDIANNMEIPLNTKKTKWFVLTKVRKTGSVNIKFSPCNFSLLGSFIKRVAGINIITIIKIDLLSVCLSVFLKTSPN